MDRKQSDGVIQQRFVTQAHEDRLYVEKQHDPVARKLILEHNAKLRDHGLRDLSFGRQILSVPEGDMMRLRIQYPDIESDDGLTRKRAWLKVFRMHPEYRVSNKS